MSCWGSDGNVVLYLYSDRTLCCTQPYTSATLLLEATVPLVVLPSTCYCQKVGDLAFIQSQFAYSFGEDRVPFLHRNPSVCSSLPYLGNVLVNDFVHVERWSIHARIKIQERRWLVNPGSPLDGEIDVLLFVFQFSTSEPLNMGCLVGTGH